MKKIQNKVFCGDAANVMDSFPEESVDLVVTSPPYNARMEYDNYVDDLPWDEYYSQCSTWLKAIYRVMKKDGRVCINHYFSMGNGKKRTAPLMELNTIAQSIGFKHHSVAFWSDNTIAKLTAWGSWLSASAPYISSPYEGILILYKESWKKLNKGVSTMDKENFIKFVSGIWKVAPEKNRTHPAPFPSGIAEKCIRGLSYEGDVVLDPFIGSGTTAVVAKSLCRDYVGIDMSQKYVDMTNERLGSK